MNYSDHEIENAYVAQLAQNELREFMIENPKNKDG